MNYVQDGSSVRLETGEHFCSCHLAEDAAKLVELLNKENCYKQLERAERIAMERKIGANWFGDHFGVRVAPCLHIQGETPSVALCAAEDWLIASSTKES
jgi:hypothetical protein